MTIEIEEIKQIRHQLGITQTELANLAQVSQSLIAKIESGNIDPTYTKVKKIFNALNSIDKKKKIKAEEIMNCKIISVQPSIQIKDAINSMKRHGISQLPVINKGNVVGLISESILLDALLAGKHDHKLKEVMKEAPPTISKDTIVDVISGLLKFFPMVLVTHAGKHVGIITKADLIHKMYR